MGTGVWRVAVSFPLSFQRLFNGRSTGVAAGDACETVFLALVAVAGYLRLAAFLDPDTAAKLEENPKYFVHGGLLWPCRGAGDQVRLILRNAMLAAVVRIQETPVS